MSAQGRPITILIADDDLDDCLLTREALRESRLANDLHFVHDGEQLLDYLLQRGKYTPPVETPRPGIIILDLNMPRMNGREALARIKSDPTLHDIPVVVLTTSRAEADVYRSYELGANSFISKPVTFAGPVTAMRALGAYWFEIVELPSGERRN